MRRLVGKEVKGKKRARRVQAQCAGAERCASAIASDRGIMDFNKLYASAGCTELVFFYSNHIAEYNNNNKSLQCLMNSQSVEVILTVF